MRYLRGTSNLCLVYGSSGFTSDIVGYTDSDYDEHLLRRRSLACYVFSPSLVVLLVGKQHYIL